MRCLYASAVLLDGDPDQVFSDVVAFERFEAVPRAGCRVTVEQFDTGHRRSSWEVQLRDGPLRWQQQEQLDSQRRRLRFERTQGDIPLLAGAWTVTAVTGEILVSYYARLDWDAPELVETRELAVAEALLDSLEVVLAELLGPDAEVRMFDEAVPAVEDPAC